MKTSAELRPRLRIVVAGGQVFGPGKAELLGHIAVTGSIRASAARMKMSYARAWNLVRQANRLFASPLVAAVRGGASGGGAVLTARGRRVLRLYARMVRTSERATRRDWAALRRLLR